MKRTVGDSYHFSFYVLEYVGLISKFIMDGAVIANHGDLTRLTRVLMRENR
jgi:hypothetical protein